MKKMKKYLTLFLAVLVMVSCVACGGSKDPAPIEPAAPSEEPPSTSGEVQRTYQDIHVASSTSTGAGYLAMCTVAALLSQEYPEYYTLTPEVTTGGTANLNMMLDGNASIAQAMLDDALACNSGGRGWADNTKAIGNLRYITGSSPAYITQFVRKDSGAKELSDMVGKRIAVASGTMYNYYWQPMLDAYGLTESSFASVEVSTIKDMLQAIQDGTIDYGVHCTNLPNTSIQDTAMNVGLNILTMNETAISALLESVPGMVRATITADTYGADFDAEVVGIYNVWVTTADADEQMIYDFVKCITEHHDEIVAAAAMCEPIGKVDLALENQLIDWHPGAERYFKEIGAIQ